jgi:hypothetical protein
VDAELVELVEMIVLSVGNRVIGPENARLGKEEFPLELIGTVVVVVEIDMVVAVVVEIVMLLHLAMAVADTATVNVIEMEIELMIGMKVVHMAGMVIEMPIEVVIVMEVEVLLVLKGSIESAVGLMIVQVELAVPLLMMTVIRLSCLWASNDDVQTQRQVYPSCLQCTQHVFSCLQCQQHIFRPFVSLIVPTGSILAL